MKKYFVFADVHSFYDELMEALNRAGFDRNNEDHVIVSLGDLCDRGPQSREVLSFVNSLPEDRKLIVIGNHEILMELMIKRGRANGADTYNGTTRTAMDITEEDENIEDLKHNILWNEYKKCWHWYYEMGDCIFVHGWIPTISRRDRFGKESLAYDPDWRDADIARLYDATWVNGMEAWNKGIREKGKTIFCGHWNSSWGNCYLHHKGSEFGTDADYGPFIDEGIVALDACTVESGRVNVYVIESDEEAV